MSTLENQRTVSLSLDSARFPRRTPMQTWLSLSMVSMGFLLGGCDRNSADSRSAKDSPTSSAEARGISSTPQVIDVPVPLLCPPGQELISMGEKKFSAEELQLINSAFYLWKTAVGPERLEERLTGLISTRKLPPLNRLDPNNKLTPYIRAALAGTHMAAAYANMEVETINETNGEPKTYHFEFYVFNKAGDGTAYFDLVDSFAHETLHQVQKRRDPSEPSSKANYLQRQFRWEAEAYAQGVEDLKAVAAFLKTSDRISPADREKYLNAWLSEIDRNIRHSQFYRYRHQVQYELSGLSGALHALGEYSESKGVDCKEFILDLRSKIDPMLVYQATVEMNPERIGELYSTAENWIKNTEALRALEHDRTRQLAEYMLSIFPSMRENVRSMDQADRARAVDK